MTKREKTKKTDKDDFLTKNHNHAIKYRKRVQEEMEIEQELKDFLLAEENQVKEQDAGKPLQDHVRREHFQE